MDHDGRHEDTSRCSMRLYTARFASAAVVVLGFALSSCSGGGSPADPLESMPTVAVDGQASDEDEMFEPSDAESNAADDIATPMSGDAAGDDEGGGGAAVVGEVTERDGQNTEPEVEASRPAADSDGDPDADSVDTDAGGIPNAIDVTVPNVERPIDEPVPPDEAAAPVDGVEIRLVRREAVDVTSELPGEIGGPAVLVGVEFSNETGSEVDLGAVTINLEYGPDDVPASQVTTEPAEPVSGVLVDGARTTGLYVFTVPPDARSDIDLYVSYSVDVPTSAFTGQFPNG